MSPGIHRYNRGRALITPGQELLASRDTDPVVGAGMGKSSTERVDRRVTDQPVNATPYRADIEGEHGNLFGRAPLEQLISLSGVC